MTHQASTRGRMNQPVLRIAENVIRDLLIGVLYLGLILTLSGCVGAFAASQATPTTAYTKTASLSTATKTSIPTPTQTPTATMPAIETKTSAEETSRYFKPEFQLDLEGSVDGINIPFTIGLHKSIVERVEEPVKTISVNRLDAPDLYAKFWLTICWQKYIQQNPSQAGISFAEYEDLVKNGEGEIQVAAVDENSDSQINEILTFHPENGFVVVSVDESVHLAEDGNTLFSFYLGRNSKGQLVISENCLKSYKIFDARTYVGQQGFDLDGVIGLTYSVYVAEDLEFILTMDNEALISSTTYWKVAGLAYVPDYRLYLDPIINNTQFSEKEPLLIIGQK